MFGKNYLIQITGVASITRDRLTQTDAEARSVESQSEIGGASVAQTLRKKQDVSTSLTIPSEIMVRTAESSSHLFGT